MINIAIEQNQIYDEDYDALIDRQSKEQYCDNFIAIQTDCGMSLYLLENCTIQTIVAIFEQAPYLELTWNIDDLKNTGEHLDIKFIFYINEGWIERCQ